MDSNKNQIKREKNKQIDPKDATRVNVMRSSTQERYTLPEKKYQDKKKKVRARKEYTEAGNTLAGIIKTFAYITFVLVLSVTISIIAILFANDIYGFVKSDEPIEIEIPENATVDDIAEILHENKLISYEWLFKMKAGDSYDDVKFSAGKYTLSAKNSYDGFLYLFIEKAPSGVSWVTIPEGYTVDNIIDLLVNEFNIGEREKYVDVINNYDFDFWFIDELGDNWAENGRFYRLEGYLFPDTYQFYNASSEETVIRKLLARFKYVFTTSYRERCEELGMSTDEIITIASMIEKEAGGQADFGNVSSVFHNRLADPVNFALLNSDATVVYAIEHDKGEHIDPTPEDLKYETPYNTYLHEGLPPGPIANPSNSAILSALHPTETYYYYFVSDGKKTYFSSSLEEHNYYISLIQQQKEGNGD